MSLKEKITHKFFETGGKLRVKSALNPVLWLCVFVTIPCLLIGSQLTIIPDWLIVLAFIPVGLAALGFLFLLIFDRDKLQSEEYQIKKQSLELIREKGLEFPIDPTSINSIANPEQPRMLESGQGTE